MRPVFFRRDTKTRQEVYVFLVCVGLSLFLWLLIKASAESEASVSFPVEFVNIPEDKILVNSPVKEVTLRFEEKAASLFFYKYFMEHDPVRISVSDLSLKEVDSHYKARMFTTHIMDYLNKHKDIPYTIITISPDTIPVIFEDKTTTRVPLVANFDLGFKKQYDLYDTVRIIPDSITISGPSSVIDTLERIHIGDYDFSEMEETKEFTVDLHEYIKNDLLSYEPKKAEIVIPVAQYTEASIDVPVSIETNTSLEIRTFPSVVNVRYLVALQDYQDIRPEMFRAVVDVDPATLQERQKLKVRLDSHPEKVRILYTEPDRVEFIIIQ